MQGAAIELFMKKRNRHHSDIQQESIFLIIQSYLLNYAIQIYTKTNNAQLNAGKERCPDNTLPLQTNY
jgi:hypothetical protein